mmetsp:Transcript_26542/g.43432  ORF Transcript_26542/g.43432 Transcript_26542/m.43432 type:complete len:231 (-) Transcript_26542:1043-1735(-)
MLRLCANHLLRETQQIANGRLKRYFANAPNLPTSNPDNDRHQHREKHHTTTHKTIAATKSMSFAIFLIVAQFIVKRVHTLRRLITCVPIHIIDGRRQRIHIQMVCVGLVFDGRGSSAILIGCIRGKQIALFLFLLGGEILFNFLRSQSSVHKLRMIETQQPVEPVYKTRLKQHSEILLQNRIHASLHQIGRLKRVRKMLLHRLHPTHRVAASIYIKAAHRSLCRVINVVH